ncbi:hypothetical protein UlMin_007870 [Ulmus minor]
MKHDESITQMYTRFTDIINDLSSLGKEYSISEKVRKILRSLPKQWEAKVTAIQEAKNLSTLPLDELVGSLMTHEMTMKQNSDDSVKTDKEKNLAFSSSTSNSVDENDVVLLARKFKKFLKHDRKNRRSLIKDSDERPKRSEVICYECNKPRHIKPDCPQLKHGKKKAMVATWDDSDSSESESENDEQASVCFMTIQDEVSKRKNTWILDSGCSRHMTGDIQQFSSLEKKVGGKVTFGDDAKGNILGKGTVGNSSSPLIENVLHVENLSYNLMSVSQLCDKGFRVVFESSKCFIMDSVSDEIIFVGKRFDNVFTIDINVAKDVEKCFVSISNESWLWHRRLGHANMDLLNKLSTKQLVKGLPSVTFQKDKVCDACEFGKQIKSSFKSKKIISTSRPLELLHLNLFGPMRTASLGGKFYVFVIVDDFSRFTWTLFLTHKNKAFQTFSNLCKCIQNEKGLSIVSIRSDHGKEFENKDFENFCLQNGSEHNFSAPRTPQQNGEFH